MSLPYESATSGERALGEIQSCCAASDATSSAA